MKLKKSPTFEAANDLFALEKTIRKVKKILFRRPEFQTILISLVPINVFHSGFIKGISESIL